MWFKQHRKQALAFFIATLLFIVLMAASFWNYSIKVKIDLGVWLLLFFLLSIISASLLYTVFLKATDSRLTESLINEKVAEVRTRILSEMDKKEEVKTDEGFEVDEKANTILPKGNFKTSESYAKKLLANMATEMQIVMGIIYVVKNKTNTFSYLTGYAMPYDKIPPDFKSGENLNGQVALNKEITILRNLPEEYFTIESGLGKSKPRNIIIAPLVNNNKTIAIIEIATFIEIETNTELLMNKICSLAADKMAEL
jgi:hypothetical protein